MREALRAYLNETETASPQSPSDDADSLDELVVDRVDALIAERLDEAFTPRRPQDINVNIALDGETQTDADVERASHTASPDPSHDATERKTEPGIDESDEQTPRNTCTQCGETLSSSHVYCPNCGEKASHRVFCECGDELRSDWGFCPSCGRRTPAADVLDQS